MSSPTDLQEKIAAARREAETLKEKIRAKRDQLADTSRKRSSCSSALAPAPCTAHPLEGFLLILDAVLSSARHGR